MYLQIPIEMAISGVAALIGIIATLFANNIRYENKSIKIELDAHKQAYDKDLRANLDSHAEMWRELKERRKEAIDAHDALVKLTTTIEHHNELLVGIRDIMKNVVSVPQCEQMHRRLEERIGRNNGK